MPKTKDTELEAMTKITSALSALDEPTRDRVLGWANAKWGKRVEEFATTLLPTVERVAENPREPLPPIGGSVLGKDPKRG